MLGLQHIATREGGYRHQTKSMQIKHKATTLKEPEDDHPPEEPPLPVTVPVEVVRALFTPDRMLNDRQPESHEATPREVIAPPADPNPADVDAKDTS